MKDTTLNPSKVYKVISVLLVFLLILTDVLYFGQSSDFRTFPILFFYIACIVWLKIRANITFLMCLVLVILIYTQYTFSNPILFAMQSPQPPIGERMSVWLYLLLIIGMMQKWLE